MIVTHLICHPHISLVCFIVSTVVTTKHFLPKSSLTSPFCFNLSSLPIRSVHLWTLIVRWRLLCSYSSAALPESANNFEVAGAHHRQRPAKTSSDHEECVGLGRGPQTEAEGLSWQVVIHTPANQRWRCKYCRQGPDTCTKQNLTTKWLHYISHTSTIPLHTLHLQWIRKLRNK